MHLDSLFSQLIREKQFLSNVLPRTVKAFKYCQRADYRTVGDESPDKQNIKEYVINYMHRVYRLLRSMNP
jgi:hypothetical protein